MPLSSSGSTADMIFGTRIDVIADFLPTFDSHDKREALAQFIGVETLVLNGAQDLLTPPEHSEEIVAAASPAPSTCVVNDAGHIIMLEHPEVVNEQLLALIERGLRAAVRGRRGRAASRGCAAPCTDVAKQRRVAGLRRPGSRASCLVTARRCPPPRTPGSWGARLAGAAAGPATSSC